MRDRLLAFVVWLALRLPWAVLLVAGALTVFCGTIGLNPELRSSQLDMIPRDNPVVKHWTSFTEDFDILADLFVVAKAPKEKLDRAKAFAVRLERELAAHPDYVKSVEYRLDPKIYDKQSLYFMSLTEVENMRSRVHDQLQDLALLSRSPGLFGLANVFLFELRRKEEAAPEDVKAFFEFIRRAAVRIEDVAAGRRAEEMPWRAFFGMAEELEIEDDPFADDGWKLSREKTGLLIAVHPSNSTDELEFIVPFYETCRGVVDRLKKEFPDVEVGLTGQPAMSYSQQDVVGQDLRFTSAVSFVAVTLIFFWAFHGFGLPLLAITALLCAIVWTFGVIHFSPGYLNLITITFVSILLGEGIDYGIYIVSQYGERRREGLAAPDAVRAAVFAAGPGIVTGACTSCAGFLALMMTDFTGFRELGQIAAAGIVLCMLAMLTVLPALLGLAGQFATRLGTGNVGRTERALEWLARKSIQHALPVLVVFFGGAFFLLVEGLGVQFDYNILNLEPEGTEAVEYDRVMQTEFEIVPDTVMVTAADLSEALRLKRELEKLSTVGNVDSLSNFVPEDAEAKRKLFAEISAEIATIRFDREEPLDAAQLADRLDVVAKELKDLKKLLIFAYGGEIVLAAAEAEVACRSSAAAIRKASRAECQARLVAYQRQSFKDLSEGFEDFRSMLHVAPIELDKIPEPTKARYRGRKTGRYVLFVSPGIDVRLENQAKRFILQVRSIAPEATGVPILIDEVLGLLRTGFRQATEYSLLSVLLLVLIDFRDVRLTLLALAPLLVSLSMTIGIMQFAGLKYNPANFVAVPVTIGLGMTFGVYLIHRMRQDPEGGAVKALRSTGKSVTASCLTSLAGFGSLMLAQNRGLHSLGLLLFIGLSLCLLTCLVMLPALAEVVGTAENRLRRVAREVKASVLGYRM